MLSTKVEQCKSAIFKQQRNIPQSTAFTEDSAQKALNTNRSYWKVCSLPHAALMVAWLGMYRVPIFYRVPSTGYSDGFLPGPGTEYRVFNKLEKVDEK